MMAHLQLFAKFSFLSCTAPGVQLRPRLCDMGQRSSLLHNLCSWHVSLRSFWPTQGLGEDTAQALIFSLLLQSNEKINDQRKNISLSGYFVPQQEQSSWKSPPMPGELQSKKILLVIVHAVNFWFSLLLAGKPVSTLGILLQSLYCQLSQGSNYWFRCRVGGKKNKKTGRHELPPKFLAQTFLMCHAQSAGGQAAQAAVPSCCASLIASPPHILFSPAPPRTRSGSPAMLPFQMSPSLLFPQQMWARQQGLLTDTPPQDTPRPKPRNSRPKPSLPTKPQKPGLL